MIKSNLSTDEHSRVTIGIQDGYSGSYRRMTYKMDASQAEAYLAGLIDHITYVREAGERLGVSKDQLKAHDNSKFSPEEFPHYAAYFHAGIRESTVSDGFANAWLHHIHHNPHHWQYWMFPDGFTPKGSSVENGVVTMPHNYALEMIADWMGASMTYTGSYDMADWLWKNMPRIRLHSRTAEYVRSVLDGLGYADVVNMQRWASQTGEQDDK